MEDVKNEMIQTRALLDAISAEEDNIIASVLDEAHNQTSKDVVPVFGNDWSVYVKSMYDGI